MAAKLSSVSFRRLEWMAEPGACAMAAMCSGVLPQQPPGELRGRDLQQIGHIAGENAAQAEAGGVKGGAAFAGGGDSSGEAGVEDGGGSAAVGYDGFW